MPVDHHSINENNTVQSEIIDLGLKMPKDFDVQSILSVERLLKMHPNWFVSNLTQEADKFTAAIKDYATEETSTLSGEISLTRDNERIIQIQLNGTVDICIRFFNTNGSLAVQTHSPEAIDPADPVLLWIRAILQYIRLYVKTTPVTLFFRLVMNKMILQMDPSQRKISMMIAKITLIEVLVIVLIVVGYVIFVL